MARWPTRRFHRGCVSPAQRASQPISVGSLPSSGRSARPSARRDIAARRVEGIGTAPPTPRRTGPPNGKAHGARSLWAPAGSGACLQGYGHHPIDHAELHALAYDRRRARRPARGPGRAPGSRAPAWREVAPCSRSRRRGTHRATRFSAGTGVGLASVFVHGSTLLRPWLQTYRRCEQRVLQPPCRWWISLRDACHQRGPT
jgi:hypothetical protein